ncbi:MAG TPA: RNA-binding protein [Candidatus Paceibacterota bacterium]
MATKLFVGNLPFSATDDSIREAFAPYGTVTSASVVMDRETGRSRGFGFVEYEGDGQAAIDAWNGKAMDGRPLTVNVARPREDRPRF